VFNKNKGVFPILTTYSYSQITKHLSLTNLGLVTYYRFYIGATK